MMGCKAKVEKLLEESEARTGNRVRYYIGHSQKIGHLPITACSHRAHDLLSKAFLGPVVPKRQRLGRGWGELKSLGISGLMQGAGPVSFWNILRQTIQVGIP